jgi:ATP-binding cassette subfamily B protein
MNTDTDIDQNAGGHEARIEGRLEFDRVSFRYNASGPWVLRDISFEVAPGARVAIVGPTGSGKSTLVKLLQRLYDVSEGTIRVDGVDLRRWRLDSLRGQMGVIEQDTFLFSRTIAENIAFGRPGSSRDEIEAAAKAAQAHDFIMELEKGYETVVGTRGLTLSGGQKQRLAIARAILADPRILALDDATSAVDSATEDRIQKAIGSLIRGRTSIVITHRLAQIRHADLILVMKRGRIVAKGTHEELIRRSPDYRDVFDVYGAALPPLEV